jgi:phosphatidylserine/phosphatidylglycerophosphate/cardiolipin synthase-like enzyme
MKPAVPLLLAAWIVQIQISAVAAASPNIQVYFSPKGGCTEAVVDALSKARSTVLVQAYSFTSQPIAKALVDAHRRGVKLQVILDKNNQTDKYSAATFTQNYGIPTFIDARHSIAHNKIIIIDARTVLTGSFNFTMQAEESNAENLLIIDDPTLAAKYMTNWNVHFAHSKPYERKEPAGKQR